MELDDRNDLNRQNSSRNEPRNRTWEGESGDEVVSELQRAEERWRAAQHVGGIGLWEVNVAEGRIRFSEEAYRIFGCAPGELDGPPEKFLPFVHPDDRERVSAGIARFLQGSRTLDLEHRFLRPDGEMRYLHARTQADTDVNGQVLISGTVHDVTERRKCEEALRRKATLLALAGQLTRVGGWTVDLLSGQVSWSDELCRIIEMPEGSMLTMEEAFRFVAPEWRASVRAHFEKCRREGTAYDQEFQLVTASGRKLWARTLARPIRDAQGIVTCFQGALQDISEYKEREEQMRQLEERFRNAARLTIDVIWDWDLQTDFMSWGEGIGEALGYSEQDLEPTSVSWTSRIHPEDKAWVVSSIESAIDGTAQTWSCEYRMVRKDGSYAYVLDRGAILRNPGGKAVRMVGAMTDLTERKNEEQQREQAQARIREQASLLDKARDAIVVRGIDERILYWNKGAERLYGWTSDESLGRRVEEVIYDDPAAFRAARAAVVQTGEWRGELEERRKDGSRIIVDSHWTLMRDEDGQPRSIFSINTDITQRKAAEQKIQHLAYYDALTGLPNRGFLMDRLQHALAASGRSGHMGALMFLDLDNFKTLNDTLGHDKGDLLLQQVAQRLRHAVRESDTVARLGGDEFVVMLEELGEGMQAAAPQALKAGEKVLAAFSRPFALDRVEHHSTPSLGVTLFKGHQDQVEDILKRADLAMYQAKAAGRNTVRFFDPQMQEAVTQRAALEAELRHGAQHDEFVLYYQPQVEGRRRPIGVEALLRWQHPRRGLVQPSEFISLAEESGMILTLGRWVMNSACRQLAAWARQPETASLVMAVNVSASQFRHPDFVADVLGALDRSGADPGKLELELTESVLVVDMDATIAKMTALRTRGVRFALDDFGTGYSSLYYLKRLPLDQLKIDKSFVRDVLIDRSDAMIARTVVTLGQSLGLGVIAEGVETRAQQRFLARNGCHAYQGYLFSRPLPEPELRLFLSAAAREARSNGLHHP